MQTEMYHIRLSSEASKVIKQQAERCDISATALAGMLLKAASEAIRDASGPIIPPSLEMSGAANLQETPPPYGKKK